MKEVEGVEGDKAAGAREGRAVAARPRAQEGPEAHLAPSVAHLALERLCEDPLGRFWP